MAIAAAAPGSFAAAELAPFQGSLQALEEQSSSMHRPADLPYWVTLGTTLRLKAGAQSPPHEMRHVQVESGAFELFRRDGAFPDGATFAVTFYELGQSDDDAAGAGAEPVLVAQKKERFLGVEVLDARHPDGRRFYSFPPGAQTADPLPAGNACATCHMRAAGTQGIFVQHYPLATKVR